VGASSAGGGTSGRGKESTDGRRGENLNRNPQGGGPDPRQTRALRRLLRDSASLASSSSPASTASAMRFACRKSASSMTPMSHPSPPLADFLPESMIDSSPLALLKPAKRRRHDFQKPSGSRLPIRGHLTICSKLHVKQVGGRVFYRRSSGALTASRAAAIPNPTFEPKPATPSKCLGSTTRSNRPMRRW